MLETVVELCLAHALVSIGVVSCRGVSFTQTCLTRCSCCCAEEQASVMPAGFDGVEVARELGELRTSSYVQLAPAGGLSRTSRAEKMRIRPQLIFLLQNKHHKT